MTSKIFHGNVGNVYYQIIKSYRTNLMTVCCMQDFDECDYDQSRFCRNSNNAIHCFETEEMAVLKLNEWYEPELIDDEYRNCKSDLVRD